MEKRRPPREEHSRKAGKEPHPIREVFNSFPTLKSGESAGQRRQK